MQRDEWPRRRSRMSGALGIPIPPELLDELTERIRVQLETEPRYVTKEKLADRLGISPRTVKTWRSKGLPACKVGRELMFNIQEVDRWIEGYR